MIWDWYETWLEQQLKKLGFSLSAPKALSNAILTLSDTYQSKNLTPWQKPETTAAYLSYFLPLNFIRAQSVFEILKTQGPTLAPELKIIDFGSGAGTSELALAQAGLTEGQIDFVDIAKNAQALHQSLHEQIQVQFPNFKMRPQWLDVSPRKNYDLGIFQTSLNEIDHVPEVLTSCDTLILIEAATSEKARPLMALRRELMAQGYAMWAPCTHQQDCPLLVESKRDWCHDRVYPELPSWFQNLLPHLPIENAELTFSYLIASRQKVSEASPRARVVGEPLWEKGKVRQMVCRSDKREFMSWLRRKGDPVTPRRGDLISAASWPPPGRAEIRMESEAEILWGRPHKN